MTVLELAEASIRATNDKNRKTLDFLGKRVQGEWHFHAHRTVILGDRVFTDKVSFRGNITGLRKHLAKRGIAEGALVSAWTVPSPAGE